MGKHSRALIRLFGPLLHQFQHTLHPYRRIHGNRPDSISWLQATRLHTRGTRRSPQCLRQKVWDHSAISDAGTVMVCITDIENVTNKPEHQY